MLTSRWGEAWMPVFITFNCWNKPIIYSILSVCCNISVLCTCTLYRNKQNCTLNRTVQFCTHQLSAHLTLLKACRVDRERMAGWCSGGGGVTTADLCWQHQHTLLPVTFTQLAQLLMQIHNHKVDSFMGTSSFVPWVTYSMLDHIYHGSEVPWS